MVRIFVTGSPTGFERNAGARRLDKGHMTP